jgi:general secretion pathway protein L
MAEILYIRLGSQANDAVHWLVWSNDEQEIIASGELINANELHQLTEKAKHRQVVTFVACSELVLKSLNVPAKSTKAIRLAVPYMLEDELAQDVEQLFFAYSTVKDQSKEHNCFVAAVEHQQLQSWLAWLKTAGIECKVMVPDALAMPLKPDAWQVIQLAEQILIRQGEWQALTIDVALWPTFLALWIKQNPAVVLESYSPLPATEIECTVVQKAEELPLALLAQQNSKHTFNLLQGDYRVKTKQSPVIKNWAWAAGIATFALLMNLLFKVTTLIQINDQQVSVEQEIISIYKAAFPKTKRVRISTIRSQLKRKLSDVGSTANSETFLLMLDKLVPAFSQIPELKPQSFKFDSKRNELRMQATASAYLYFEKFKTLLEASQLSVAQGSQNNQGDVISGSFSISHVKKGAGS